MTILFLADFFADWEKSCQQSGHFFAYIFSFRKIERLDDTWATKLLGILFFFIYILKGQSHENVGELRVWGVCLGSN
jgi:hypothetical protein